MIFTNNYNCLSQNEFTEADYKIVPIRYEDRLDVMKWRNEQIYHLRQDTLLTEKSQENYFNKTVARLFEQEKPNQILFSYLKDDICIGYGGLVHINWIDSNAEISFIMDTSLESKEFEIHWTCFLKLITQVAFLELKLKKIFTFAYDLRPHLYPVLEKNGFELTSKLKNKIKIQGKEIDVIIHEKKNIFHNLQVRKCRLTDLQLIFDWSNDPLVRSQSFNQEEILLENHIKWFKNKLQNKNSLLLINEYDNIPAGLVRLDIEKDKTTIGVLIDSLYRGKGLSSIMLIKSTLYYFETFDKPINAFIKKSNKLSIRAFEKAGFEFLKYTVVNKIPTVLYKLEKK